MKIENLSVSEGDGPLNKERLIFFCGNTDS